MEGTPKPIDELLASPFNSINSGGGFTKGIFTSPAKINLIVRAVQISFIAVFTFCCGCGNRSDMSPDAGLGLLIIVTITFFSLLTIIVAFICKQVLKRWLLPPAERPSLRMAFGLAILDTGILAIVVSDVANMVIEGATLGPVLFVVFGAAAIAYGINLWSTRVVNPPSQAELPRYRRQTYALAVILIPPIVDLLILYVIRVYNL